MLSYTIVSLSCADVLKFARVTGQIGYSLAIQVSRGTMLGPDQPIILHLLDIPPASQSLDGVKMELIDAALPLVHGAPALQTVATKASPGKTVCRPPLALSKAVAVAKKYPAAGHVICMLDGDGSAISMTRSDGAGDTVRE